MLGMLARVYRVLARVLWYIIQNTVDYLIFRNASSLSTIFGGHRRMRRT
jgi:hypothetical protein